MSNPPSFTLNRETLRRLDAVEARDAQQVRDGRLPTTTVLTRFISCTAC